MGQDFVGGLEAPTTVAPDADVLSEFEEAMERVARADEALPFAAITVDALLVRVDNRITPADGIGALLRYAPTGGLASQPMAEVEEAQ